MSTNTPIASQTLGSAASSVTFTGIPQNFTDLVCVVNGGSTTNNQSFFFQFNSDSSSLYSYTYIAGSGSAASSSRVNPTTGIASYNVNGQSDNQIKSQAILQLQNYSNTTTFKSYLTRNGSAASGFVGAIAGLVQTTSAINIIEIAECGMGGTGFFNYGNMLSGSTFTLYGIKAE